MRIVTAVAAAALFSSAAITSLPARAAIIVPAVFNLTAGSNVDVQDGSAKLFSAHSSSFGTFNMRASAWSLEANAIGTFVRNSKLMVYGGGLGVLSSDDGDGSQNRHTIDNGGRKDFILLQFDRQVRLTSATFNTFSVLGAVRDSDATIRRGITANPWNQALAMNNKPVAQLDALFIDGWSSLITTTGNSTRNPNPQLLAGNLWLIGADFSNSDRRTDGFTLAAIAVIPEPASWATMVWGFGLAGAALRRRQPTAFA